MSDRGQCDRAGHASVDCDFSSGRCPDCGATSARPLRRNCPKKIHLLPPLPPRPDEGPGTELHKLTAELKLPRKPGCTCAALERRMDMLGVEGCREHRAELLAELQKNYELYDAKDKRTAAWHALTSGLAVKINPLDPLGSLLDVAIEKARTRTTAPP